MVAVAVVHVADHARQPGARRGPGRSTSRRSSCPTARRSSARRRWSSRSRRRCAAIRTTRTSSPSPASTSSAAASATTRPRCSSRRSHGTSATSPRSSSSASSSRKTAGIKDALVLAFNPPPIFGLGTTGGYEFYIQNRGNGGAKELSEVKDAFLARANRDPQLGGAQTLWHAAVPQLFVDVDRDKAKKAGVRDHRHLQRAVGDDGQLLRQRLQQVRPHLAGAAVGRARVPQAPGRRRRRLRALGAGRDDSARRRWSRSTTRRAPTRSIASTTCRR